MRNRAAAVMLASGIALAPTSVEAHKPTVTKFTFHGDIYPIFEAKCGACHRSGGVAPMSLLSYEEAYPWAVSIKNEVLSLAMPPWFADERYGTFKHGAGLTASELNTIVDWCLGGTPEGDARPRVADAAVSRGWALGAPDLELTMPRAITLGPNENERMQTVRLGALSEERFIRAFDFRPGAANVVRSALVYAADRLIGAWTSGVIPQSLPAGSGYRVPKGAELSVALRYRKTWLDEGRSVEDRSTLALYFHEGDALEVEPVAVGADGYVLAGGFDIVALLPTVPNRGEAFVAELVRPDGSRSPILRLHDPNPDFPRTYWLETPLVVPHGTRVESSHMLVLSLLRE